MVKRNRKKETYLVRKIKEKERIQKTNRQTCEETNKKKDIKR